MPLVADRRAGGAGLGLEAEQAPSATNGWLSSLDYFANRRNGTRALSLTVLRQPGGNSMSRVVEDYRLMASRCLLLAAETTDEQHKSVLLRAAAKFNDLADRHRYRLAHRQRHNAYTAATTVIAATTTEM
jgi:hypothetical protein